ncbi:glycosyltransferase family 2 protein [Paenibacillus sp. P25]|nr:glycosyltransferase family 2 protein [Paenibacillus sp. P25]
MAAGYLRGFFSAKRRKVPDWVLLPTDRSVAVIVSARNEERTIGALADQLSRLGADETYVVVNGSTDRTFLRARERSSGVVLSYPEALGHDVGRAVGAKLAEADILVFLDGDIPVKAEDLVPFIYAVSEGMDVALNNITPYLAGLERRDPVSHIKQFLNLSLGRPDLAANSMTAVPHALSRKAVDTLGPQALMVPPKAQALAVFKGLRIGAPGQVNVIRSNRRRRNNLGPGNPVAKLIIGDHVEALKLAGDLEGERLAFADHMRKRSLTGSETDANDEHHPHE